MNEQSNPSIDPASREAALLRHAQVLIIIKALNELESILLQELDNTLVELGAKPSG